jgi:hypothetical protein
VPRSKNRFAQIETTVWIPCPLFWFTEEGGRTGRRGRGPPCHGFASCRFASHFHPGEELNQSNRLHCKGQKTGSTATAA